MPHIIEVRRNRTDKHPVRVEYDFGTDITDAQAKFNGNTALDNVVFDLFVHAAKAQLTSYVQKLLDSEDPETKKAYTPAKITSLVAAWKPDTNRRAKASVSKIATTVKGLSPAERAALRAQLDEEDEAADKV